MIRFFALPIEGAAEAERAYAVPAKTHADMCFSRVVRQFVEGYFRSRDSFTAHDRLTTRHTAIGSTSEFSARLSRKYSFDAHLLHRPAVSSDTDTGLRRRYGVPAHYPDLPRRDGAQLGDVLHVKGVRHGRS